MELAELLTHSAEQGVFAALFMFSFMFIIKENKRREDSQSALYEDLAGSLEKAKDAIASIEGKIERIDGAQTNISDDLMEVKYMIKSIENAISQKNGK